MMPAQIHARMQSAGTITYGRATRHVSFPAQITIIIAHRAQAHVQGQRPGQGMLKETATQCADARRTHSIMHA